ncbi:MAG: transporter substrate-binding domain-containing protein [Pseudomonadota bacterium]
MQAIEQSAWVAGVGAVGRLQNIGANVLMGVSVLMAVVAAGLVASSPSVRAQGFDAGVSSPLGEARARKTLKFLTEREFPPFNFFDEDGILTGFNVDLVRAICLEMNRTCDISAASWDTLFPTLNRGGTDAVIAAHAVTPKAVAQVKFTEPYFRTPGRFATRRDAANFEATPEGLEGRRIGVVRGSVHEAFLKRFFLGSRIVLFATPEEVRAALSARRVDAVFEDGISLAFWLNGTLSRQCCTFRGGPYLEPLFFGDGLAIAVKQGNDKLRAELNTALSAVRRSGRFQELVSRYFPLPIY